MKGVKVAGFGNLVRQNGVVLNTDSASAHAALRSRLHQQTQQERIERLESAIEKLLLNQEVENGTQE